MKDWNKANSECNSDTFSAVCFFPSDIQTNSQKISLSL